MRLRARLALTTIGVTIPVLAVLAWLYARFAEQAAEDATTQLALDIMQNGGREECEASPATWTPAPPDRPHAAPGRGRFGPYRAPAGFYAYDASLTAANPGAPAIADELRRLAERGDPTATRRVELGGRPFVDMLVRMPWRDGPCSFVLARRPSFRREAASIWRLPLVRIWGPVVAIMLAGVLVAIGPAIRRIRQLTREVRATASERYQPQIAVRGRDEIGDLARAFGEAGREIRERMDAQERREQSLRAFLDNTTHDVMTPLTVLQGHLTAIAERAAGAPEQRARVNAARNEAHYMASLLHNLSLAAKLETGEPEVASERVDLSELIERVVARHQPIARMQQIALERATPEQPLLARGDVTLLEQAVSNVVINAVQHGAPGGHVAVVLDRAEPDRFAIRVADDGPGMPAAELDRIFDRGLRGNDARTRAPSGRGLGLDIVQRVIHLHGWTLAIANTDPHGLLVLIGGPLEATEVAPPAR